MCPRVFRKPPTQQLWDFLAKGLLKCKTLLVCSEPPPQCSIITCFGHKKQIIENCFTLYIELYQFHFRKTLAARGLEELFFQLCYCVSFWFWQEIGFGFIYYVLMYLECNTVVVLCQFFGSDGKQFLMLRMYLVYNTVVRLCQFFGCGGKLFLLGNHEARGASGKLCMSQINHTLSILTGCGVVHAWVGHWITSLTLP